MQTVTYFVPLEIAATEKDKAVVMANPALSFPRTEGIMTNDGSCTTLPFGESRAIDASRQTDMFAGERMHLSFSEPQSYPKLLGDDITSELFSKLSIDDLASRISVEHGPNSSGCLIPRDSSAGPSVDHSLLSHDISKSFDHIHSLNTDRRLSGPLNSTFHSFKYDHDTRQMPSTAVVGRFQAEDAVSHHRGSRKRSRSSTAPSVRPQRLHIPPQRESSEFAPRRNVRALSADPLPADRKRRRDNDGTHKKGGSNRKGQRRKKKKTAGYHDFVARDEIRTAFSLHGNGAVVTRSVSTVFFHGENMHMTTWGGQRGRDSGIRVERHEIVQISHCDHT